ncbi:hypothetical protein CDIK_1783 [Cucumispora dikerogammari]|nr:hypothetical protein CDIK_1783 [Cucumispora dikerogammari]
MLTEDNGKNIYFLDEVGFNVVMCTKKSRSRVGTRATYVVPGLRSKNISCCCAMSKKRIFHFEAQEVPYNTSNFIEFLKTFLKKLKKNEKINAVIIMNNVPFHESLSVKTLIVGSRHRIFYLPSYSSFLNPIENLFSKWENIIRGRNLQNAEELLNHIKSASLDISDKDCEGYYRHMLSFLPLCLRSEIILDG